MRRTGHWIISAVCGAAALAIHIAPADAQQVQAGTLECRGGPDAGFILGPFTNLDCVLHVDGAPDSRYVAAVRDLNVFIGDQDVALSWKVMAPVPWLGPGDLAGGYTHDAGAGANVLAGGTSAAITLRPLNEQADPSPPPVKVENLEIRPADH